MSPPPIFTFQMPTASQDGAAGTADKLYRWAFWRFWDVTRSYITFVALYPEPENVMQARVDAWLARWERGSDRAAWNVGGYVVVSLFGRCASGVDGLRRLHHAGQDIAGPRAADACLVFARNPSCAMIVMMPGIDDMLDVRDAHQRLVLSALTGLGKPVAVVDPETQMPREDKQ